VNPVSVVAAGAGDITDGSIGATGFHGIAEAVVSAYASLTTIVFEPLPSGLRLDAEG
jgi:hypothetical protein